MRIALFDYLVIPTNAVGNCTRTLLEGLCEEHDFTVFAVEFDNPRPDRIRFMRIPAPKHPLFLMYIAYFILSPIYLFLYRHRERIEFDHIQSIESISPCGTIIYSHFCHRAYLRDHWQATKPTGTRRYARWLNHQLFALMEPLVYRQAQQVVVPSRGLARELSKIYGSILPEARVQVVSNPVRFDHMKPDAGYNHAAFRAELGFGSGDLVLVFAALGHFERKGLPLLLEALADADCPAVKLLVIGGSDTMIDDYRARSAGLGIGEQVVFVGLQKDVRPYLWASDVFAFPSAYEVFPLVSLEAAAASLPLLVTPLYGVEEFLVDGVNGWRIERDVNSISRQIRAIADHPDMIAPMGRAAMESVSRYRAESFVEMWRRLYASLALKPSAVRSTEVVT